MKPILVLDVVLPPSVSMAELAEKPWLAQPKQVQRLVTFAMMNRYTVQRVLPEELQEAIRTRHLPAPRLPDVRHPQLMAPPIPPLQQQRSPPPPPPPPPPPRKPVFAIQRIERLRREREERERAFNPRHALLNDIVRVAEERNGGAVLLQALQGAAAAPQPPEECSICWDEVEALAMLPRCLHAFCKDCISASCTAAASEGELMIPCPEKNCQERYLPAGMVRYLTPEAKYLFEVNKERKLEFNFVSCPTCRWRAKRELGDKWQALPGGVLINHPCEGPACSAVFCLRCGQLSGAHEDGVCETALVKTAKKDEKQCVANQGAKRCPHCLIYTVKVDGCDWIKCGRCEHGWCWQCLHPHNHGYHLHTYKGQIFRGDLPVPNPHFLEQRRRRRRKNAAKVVAAGAGLVIASPVLIAAGLAALVAAPVAAVAAAPVVAGVAAVRKIARMRAERRHVVAWDEWRQEETARRHQLGLPAFGVPPPLEDNGLPASEEPPLLEYNDGALMQVEPEWIEMQEINKPIALAL